MLNVQLKLSRLKKCLRIWNRVVFGNLFEKLLEAEVEAQEAILKFEEDPSPRARMEMNRTAAEYLLRLKMEEEYWRQKAAVKWVVEGERNTKFFQGWVKQRRTKARINTIEEDNQVLTGEADIRASAAKFFENLLSTEGEVLDEPDLDILQSLPADIDMGNVERNPTEEEIKKIVFGINAESASGPDGYSALFFQACWNIVGNDIVEAVADFFAGANIPR